MPSASQIRAGAAYVEMTVRDNTAAGVTQAEQRVLWYEAENAAIEKMKAAGTEIITDIDKKPFQDAVKPVWDKYGAKYAAMVKRIEAVN